MDKSTSKALVEDANSAAATLMNASGMGTSLFVINLCASQAPIANVAKSLPGLDSYRLYQVARREDGRTRYRLRLGFFTSEADAEAVLNIVRNSHPTAFATCLCDEDRKFTRGYIAEPSVPSAPPRMAPPKIAIVENKPIAKPATAPVAPKPTSTPAAAKPAAAVAKPAPVVASPTQAPSRPTNVAADTGTTNRMKVLRPAAKPEAKPAAVAATKPSAPTPSVEIELSWDPPALSVPAAAPNAPTPQVVAPSSKTQSVIKAAPVQTAAPTAHAPAKPTPTKPSVAVKPAPNDKIEAPSKLLASIELTLEKEPAAAPKAAPVAPSSNEPFRVGRGIEIPTTSLTLESAPASRPAPAPKPQASAPAATIAKPLAEPSKMKTAQASAPAPIKQAAAPATYKPGTKIPDLDSTQTIRALTSDELKDESQEKWFSIQLAVSDQPVNLDAMPRLDIFEAYRLYSVASAGSGKITHSLRIGFFREEVSAEAVCGYLRTFFNSPTVVRISIAEQARFKDPPAHKPAPKADVLDLSHARDRAPKAIPTVTMEVDTPRFDANATGSFKTSTTGMHKALSTGAHNALTSTGMHRALGATGTHKSLKAVAKAAPPATKRSAVMPKTSATGRYKALQPKKSLSEQLLDEAREVELSASGIRKLPKNDSLLSKMFGKKK